MIPEDRRQAEARTRAKEQDESTLSQVGVLILGMVALMGFLLI